MTGFRLSICLASLFLFTIPLHSRLRNHPSKPAEISDPGYVLALSAVNHFLHAWQSADLENGTVLLSNGIRHSQSADALEEFFSNGMDRGFEIARGHGHPGRYSFPVTLVTSHGSKITRRSSEIIVIETGKNDWVVDKLP